MSQQDSEKAPVTFHDVAAYFSEEEWKLLRDWQKELYKNVMKEIQQAFISLGPLIAASVFSLRAKEKEDRFPVDTQDPERSHAINRSTSDPTTKSNVLFRKKGDGNQNVIDLQDRDRREHHDCLSKGPLDFAAVVSFRIKEERETTFMDHQDSKRRDNTNCFTGFPFELEASLKNHLGAGGENRPGHSSDSAINIPRDSFRSEEGATYSMSNQDTQRRESIARPTATEPLDIAAVVSFTIKDEGENEFMDQQERRKSIHCPTGFPFVSAELEASLKDHLGAEGGENRPGHSSGPTTTPTTGPSLATSTKRTGSTCVTKSVNSVEQQQASNWDGPYSYSEFGRSCSQKLDCAKQNLIHPEGKAYACSEYGSSVNQRSNIGKHQRTQRGQKPHTSTESAMSCSESAALDQHQKIQTGLKLCICSQCGNCFEQSKVSNSGEQQNTCSECENNFCQSRNLNKDRGTHMGEIVLTCSECGKSFRKAEKLRRHQRIHTGERHYICSVCGKSFRRSDALVRHQQIHTGEKPYTCGQCGKSFRQLSHLVKHQRMHMGKNPY